MEAVRNDILPPTKVGGILKEENKMDVKIPIIGWEIVRKAIENHWFETNPTVSDSEMDETAIGVAGEIDDFIRKRNVRELELEKIKKLENDLTLMRDDFSGYAQFIQRNIRQSKEIIALEDSSKESIEAIESLDFRTDTEKERELLKLKIVTIIKMNKPKVNNSNEVSGNSSHE